MGTVKVLITGSNGQLGQKLVELLLREQVSFLATAASNNKFSKCPDSSFKLMDVTNKEQVEDAFLEYKPTHVINAAAMTNVDLCETEVELCYAVNHIAVQTLLEVAKKYDVHFIQISTDFIFDGKKKMYTEEDEANPLGEYGKSKWEGEKVLLTSDYQKISILRTSVLYGIGENLNKSNIFNWAMTQLREGKEINIVNDQFRTPTFVNDLAQACWLAIQKQAYGVFNVAGAELDSMHGFILQVAEYLMVDTSKIKTITTEQLNQKAPRPQHSGLDISKAREVLSYHPSKFLETLKLIDFVI